MSALRRKSSIALIIGIIIMLLLIPIWYVMLAPSIITSELEKIDLLYLYEGILGFEFHWMPVSVKAPIYTEEVKGDNIILKMEVNVTHSNATLREFCKNSTYVLNKFTRENVRDAPEADRNRTGYDPLFPSHLKADKDIPNAWLDNLNITGTLRFEGSIVEGGVTLYKYFINETITKEIYIPDIGLRNCTLTSTKTILIEPLSGLWVYTENERFCWMMLPSMRKYFCLEFNSTAESKAQELANAKAAYDGVQLLELYVPTILGVIAIILTIALLFNVRRLKRKKQP